MKHFSFFLLIIVAITGCKSSIQSFNESAISYADNDKRIDEQEYKALMKQISSSDERVLKQFKSDSGEIDNEKVVSYLLKYFKAKDIPLGLEDIWQPGSINKKEMPFNINVYLENSASMDGYVKGVTEFETAIYNLLGDFKINGVCDSLNLNYINNSIPFTKKDALPVDIQDFIEKLEPSTFRLKGGNRGVSDFSVILSKVLETVNDSNAVILISDFVFSPGKHADAQDYLNNQSVGIKISFAEKLKVFDLSAVVIQLYSEFNGLYFDKSDKPIQIKCKRPYYIWIIGSSNQIDQILRTKILDNIRGGYSNRLVFRPINKTNEPSYKILYRPKIGEFSAKQLNEKIISDASVSTDNQNKGLFGFNVAVDFSNSLQNSNYFLDTSNYITSDKYYHLNVEAITDKNNVSLSGFSHLLNLQTKVLRDEVLKINVIGKTPSWVNQSTSTDDTNILTDSDEQQKTFGLKYLIDGVADAFYPHTSSNIINTFSITIKK